MKKALLDDHNAVLMLWHPVLKADVNSYVLLGFTCACKLTAEV